MGPADPPGFVDSPEERALFEKILIANRGEIALRVIRACRELGVRTVAVYSEADRDSLHVRFSDEDICIGAPPARDSYLNIPRILAAAEITGADAVHPGYGFLAENAEFAEICERSGLVFIGPTADQIRKMGNKAEARRTMDAAGVPIVPGSDGPVDDAGVPIVPGSDGPVDDEEEAVEEARRIGFPVIIKASSGGGGKGMRLGEDEELLRRAFVMARNEAKAAFDDPTVYVEKYISRPRHVEIQVMGDKGDAAVLAGASIGYSNAGTVEFLLDEDRSFFFMEMNTRIQVEHPVTEAVTAVDLVKEQIRVAAGEELTLREPPALRGHAIECRINAEDPEHGFRPSPGTITAFHAPGGPGVRIDTHVYAGYHVPPYYDSLIAKLIVRANDRPEALSRAYHALEEFIVEGIHTTIPFLQTVLSHPDFEAGNVDTHFIEHL
jgi:acetyl-CoA carboxylase biotin carboxylase subunit